MSIAGDVGFGAVVTPSLGVDVAKGGEFLLVTNVFLFALVAAFLLLVLSRLESHHNKLDEGFSGDCRILYLTSIINKVYLRPKRNSSLG